MQNSVSDLVEQLVSSDEFNRETLAAELGVSVSAVSRWQLGKSVPRPQVEGRIRTLHGQVRERLAAKYSVKAQIDLHLGGEGEIRHAVDRLLHELREIFHRLGRLATRAEALDEVSKLLFAHVLSVANKGRGIGPHIVRRANEDRSPAAMLRDFVATAFNNYLPKSVAHELPPSEFGLQIKPSESALANALVGCFERFAEHPGIVGPNGIEVVDILNEVFGKFLADSFVDEKQLGQYLTPTEVVRFMVQLALDDLSSDEKNKLYSPNRCREFGLVLDPSCGVASFLAEFVRCLHGRIGSATDRVGEAAWLDNMLRHVVVGIDKSERMVRYALTNMAMFGIPLAHLRLADALARDGEDGLAMEALNDKVGLILTNPPFGAESTPADAGIQWMRSADVPQKLTSEILFLERYLTWLRPGGQLVAIVPDSILTNQSAFATLRKRIGEHAVIRAVVSLPAVTFASSGTTTKTSVLHLRKKPIAKASRRKSFVAVCLDVGYSIATRGSLRVKTTTGAGDLPEIQAAIRSQSATARLSRLIDSLEEHARWDAGFHASLPLELEQLLERHGANAIRVGDVASLVNERTDPRRGAGSFQYIEISDVEASTCTCRAKTMSRSDAPSRARKVVRAGDVLVSTVRPDRRTIGVVGTNLDGSVCTTGFGVLRPESIAPLLLAQLMRSASVTAQLLRHNIGIAYPAIDEKCLTDVVLPIDPSRLGELAQFAAEISQMETNLAAKRLSLSARIDRATNDWLNQ